MFCEKCGTAIPDGDAVCPGCSQPASVPEAAADRPATTEQYYREPLPAADAPSPERITRAGYIIAVILSAVAMTASIVYTVRIQDSYIRESWYYLNSAWEGEYYYTIAKTTLNAVCFVQFFVFCVLIRRKLPLFSTALPSFLMTLPPLLQSCASFFDFKLFGMSYDYTFKGHLEFFLPFTYTVLYLIVLQLKAELTKARLILGVVTAVHFVGQIVFLFIRFFDSIAPFTKIGLTPVFGFFVNWITYLAAYICMLAAMTVIMFTSKRQNKSA